MTINEMKVEITLGSQGIFGRAELKPPWGIIRTIWNWEILLGIEYNV